MGDVDRLAQGHAISSPQVKTQLWGSLYDAQNLGPDLLASPPLPPSSPLITHLVAVVNTLDLQILLLCHTTVTILYRNKKKR